MPQLELHATSRKLKIGLSAEDFILFLARACAGNTRCTLSQLGDALTIVTYGALCRAAMGVRCLSSGRLLSFFRLRLVVAAAAAAAAALLPVPLYVAPSPPVAAATAVAVPVRVRVRDEKEALGCGRQESPTSSMFCTS